MRKLNNSLGGLLLCLATLFLMCQALPEVKIFIGKDQTPVTGYIADYGNAPYKSRMNGQFKVVTGETSDKGAPCHKFDKETQDVKAKFALLRKNVQINRGDSWRYTCLLSTMTSHAQLAGAKAVFIEVEDKEPYKATNDFILGTNLEIPTFLVRKTDSKKWGDDDYVDIRLDSKPLSAINYELWMTSSQPETYEFLERFQNFQSLFGDSVKIIPKYVLWYDFPSKVKGYSVPQDNCVSNGRFCSPDPDAQGKMTGRTVVIEDLRQLCIWELYQADQMKWWKYMLTYGNCLKNVQVSDKLKCSENSMDDVGIKIYKVEECIDKTFGAKDGKKANYGSDRNERLEGMREEFAKKQIGAWPSVAIHDNLYAHPLEDPEALFSRLCEEFDSPPQICTDYWSRVTGPSTADYFWGIFLIVLILGGAFGLMVFLYKRMIKKELNQQMESQISSIVSQYYSMDKTGRSDE